jgi:hypothetical protein
MVKNVLIGKSRALEMKSPRRRGAVRRIKVYFE